MTLSPREAWQIWFSVLDLYGPGFVRGSTREQGMARAKASYDYFFNGKPPPSWGANGPAVTAAEYAKYGGAAWGYVLRDAGGFDAFAADSRALGPDVAYGGGSTGQLPARYETGPGGTVAGGDSSSGSDAGATSALSPLAIGAAGVALVVVLLAVAALVLVPRGR